MAAKTKTRVNNSKQFRTNVSEIKEINRKTACLQEQIAVLQKETGR
jgi:hypothetical protein